MSNWVKLGPTSSNSMTNVTIRTTGQPRTEWGLTRVRKSVDRSLVMTENLSKATPMSGSWSLLSAESASRFSTSDRYFSLSVCAASVEMQTKKKQRRSHRPWPWPAVAATAQFPFETVGRSRWADPLSTVASTKGDQDNEEETTEGRNGAADEAACGRVVH